MTAIDVRLAAEHEATACLALMPEVRGSPVELVIARENGAFAGAAGIVWRSCSTPRGFPLTVHVLPSARRIGVGRRIFTVVKDLLAGETQGIWSMRSTLESDPASSFMQACGFHQEKRQHYYRAEIVSLLEKVRPVLERLRSRGRIPAEVRVVAVRDTPLDDLSRLVFSEFGWLPQEAFEGLRLRRLRQESEPDELSIGVMVGKEIAGFILGRAEDGLGVVDANVVAPNYRRGWTNLFKMEAGLRLMISAGLTEFRFHCDDTALDTMNLARLCAANETQRRVLHYYRM